MKSLPSLCLWCVSSTLFAVPALTRGPYLQNSSPTALSVRWRTDEASLGTVRFGTAAGTLSQSASETVATTEHEVRLTGLTASTKIYYQVEADGTILATPSDCFFTSAPVTGSTAPIRFWALGDSGTGNANAAAVKNAFASYQAAAPSQFMMMLGDNAYPFGADEHYQAGVYNMYPTQLRQLPLWTTIGNHETYSSGGGPTMPYLAMFTLPTNGEAGGVASGTEYYYGFNHGNIHFVCLDSMVSSRASNGAMAQWLQADLQANLLPWTVAFFHHPPYTRGSHNSDVEVELIEMRQNILPILEGFGVDLVLSGHSHCYERSYLLDGHYGLSSTFSPANQKNAGSGNNDTTGPYRKPHLAMTPREGTVYVVNGSSGQISGGALNHPAMFLSLNQLGSLIVDVAGNRLDVRFLRENGVIADYFTLVKGPDSAPTPPAGLAALATSTTGVQLFWNDTSANEDNFLLQVSTDGTVFSPAATLAANTTTCAVTGLAASATYHFKLFARNELGDQGSSGTVVVTTPAVPPVISNLEMWRFKNFGTTADSPSTTDLSDPDKDGHSNLLEYAFGTLPASGNSLSHPFTTLTSGHVPQITFQRQELPDLIYTVESAEDVSSPNWTPIYSSTGAANTAGPVTVTVPAFNGKSFLRVKITR